MRPKYILNILNILNISLSGNTGLAAGNIVEWNTTIPLYVGQKIDAIKPKLEQITRKFYIYL